MFPKENTANKGFRTDCAACKDSNPKHRSKCQVKGVVYLGVCEPCDKEFKSGKVDKHAGVYVGETSRKLSESAGEHRATLETLDPSSYMVKHYRDIFE